MHAILIILICYKLIINRAGGFSSSWPVSIRLRPSCSRLFVSVPDFSKKGIFPYLCGSEYSQHFWVKYSSSSCQIEKSGPAFSLSLLAYCVVAHSTCQKVHFISQVVNLHKWKELYGHITFCGNCLIKSHWVHICIMYILFEWSESHSQIFSAVFDCSTIYGSLIELIFC